MSARMQRGFTLVELMTGLAIFALLLMLALPSFSIMLNNQRLRAQAESVANGLQNARAEAVKRNAQVEFVTTDDNAGIAAQVATIAPVTPTTAPAGQNWLVRVMTSPGNYDYIEGKNATSSAIMASTVSSIMFRGLGQTTLANTVTYQITNPAGGACAPGPMRCLNVTVTPGGQIRMCDPSITAAGDTRKC
jgi:type IV fimbrial biogenesis protein FimT